MLLKNNILQIINILNNLLELLLNNRIITIDLSKLKNKKIAVISPHGIGDFLMEEPCIKEISKYHQVFVIHSRLGNLLKHSPYNSVKFTKWHSLDDLLYLHELKNYKHYFDISISFSDSFIDKIINFYLKPRIITRPDNWDEITNSNLHHMKKNIYILRGLGLDTKTYHAKIYFKNNQLKYKNNIILVPGSKKPKKRWSLDKWIKLANNLYQCGENILMLGSKENFQEIKPSNLDKRFKWVFNKNILEASKLVKQAKLLISVDGGLMHIAHAVDTPTITLFNPNIITSEKIRALYPNNKHFYIDKKLEETRIQDIIIRYNELKNKINHIIRPN